MKTCTQYMWVHVCEYVCFYLCRDDDSTWNICKKSGRVYHSVKFNPHLMTHTCVLVSKKKTNLNLKVTKYKYRCIYINMFMHKNKYELDQNSMQVPFLSLNKKHYKEIPF